MACRAPLPVTDMKTVSFCSSVALSCFVFLSLASAASPGSDALESSSALKIPGATLAAGRYTVSVEDRLVDRAIVRITDATSNQHYLVLATPSARLSTPDSGNFFYFTAENNGKALRGWKCDGCNTPLEFVYPKLEAVSLTGSSAKAVLAMDPVYDKLPANLSADDMKVVTLWLVTPETITADNKGQGVKAAKLSDMQPARTADKAQSGATQVAAATKPVRLPHTATNNYQMLAGGLMLAIAGAALRLRRRRAL
jgi:LPXTG-motif cell wall-anchored protein